MSLERELNTRSESQCELCTAKEGLKVYEVQPTKEGANGAAFLCNTCIEQIKDASKIEANHWRCLNESMWSQVPAVQALAWRMLNRLSKEDWSGDLLDIMYMEDDTLEWAKALGDDASIEKVVHKDSNGVILQAGDSVVIIKDLKVKGTSFVAKRGTAVRRISLDPNNANYIEGKVDGQHIVIITEYVKKSK